MENIDKAKKLLEEERKNRIDRCQIRIQEILKEENCYLDATMIISKVGVFPQIQIVANE